MKVYAVGLCGRLRRQGPLGADPFPTLVAAARRCGQGAAMCGASPPPSYPPEYWRGPAFAFGSSVNSGVKQARLMKLYFHLPQMPDMPVPLLARSRHIILPHRSQACG